jgi:hypothetical protein
MLLLILVLLFSRAQAAGPTQRTWKKFADFLAGEMENLSLASDGRLTLAPQRQLLIDSGEPYLWDITSDPAGNLYLGTGNKGRVYRISAGGDTSLFFIAEEPEIYALAHDGRQHLYVATSPNGRIYQIDSQGSKRIFCETHHAYIWDMLFDRQGDLWVATGGKAQLLRVTPDGKAAIVLTSEAEHLRCLARDGETIFAGSSRPGLIYRIRKGESPFVLYDSGAEEVHSLAAVAGGPLYAATLSTSGPAPVMAPAMTDAALPVSPTGEEKEGGSAGGVQPPMSDLTEESPLAARSQLVAIDADGYGRAMWPLGRDDVQTLLPDPPNGLYVGTGRAGRLYYVTAAGDISLLLDVEASQISAMHRTPARELVLATSNMGLCYRLNARGKSGRFESETIDAEALSHWGTLSWQGEGALAFMTRSGNTRKPEGTWSEWQPLSRSGESWHIVSPAARFLQWRCTLQNGEKAPVLDEVTLFYRQKNRPPEIQDFVVLPPGDYFDLSQEQNPADKGLIDPPPLPKREHKKGFRSAFWQYKDPNRDPLLFYLRYRRAGDLYWRRLAGPVAQVVHAWDATQMADGAYQLKLEATDSLSYPFGSGLRAEKVSAVFQVDNTAPRIEKIEVVKQGQSGSLKFAVCDAASPVAQVRISVNAGGWMMLNPVDGICDSPCEQFIFPLEERTAPLEISIEAVDLLENSSMAYHQIKGF